MHATKTGLIIKKLKEEARQEKRAIHHLKNLNNNDAQKLVQKLEHSSSEKLKTAIVLKKKARLEDLSVYKINTERVVRKKTTKIYTYWYASWREGPKVRNVYIGSINNLDQEEALLKARKLKAEALEYPNL